MDWFNNATQNMPGWAAYVNIAKVLALDKVQAPNGKQVILSIVQM